MNSKNGVLKFAPIVSHSMKWFRDTIFDIRSQLFRIANCVSVALPETLTKTRVKWSGCALTQISGSCERVSYAEETKSFLFNLFEKNTVAPRLSFMCWSHCSPAFATAVALYRLKAVLKCTKNWMAAWESCVKLSKQANKHWCFGCRIEWIEWINKFASRKRRRKVENCRVALNLGKSITNAKAQCAFRFAWRQWRNTNIIVKSEFRLSSKWFVLDDFIDDARNSNPIWRCFAVINE